MFVIVMFALGFGAVIFADMGHIYDKPAYYILAVICALLFILPFFGKIEIDFSDKDKTK